MKIAFALCGAAAFSLLRAADSTPAPAAAAPEKIEFSRTTSTTPRVPRPGVKTDDLLNRFGNVREMTPGAPEVAAPMAPPPMRPSKAAAEKMFKEWDKQKNWAFQRPEDNDPSESLTKLDNNKDDDLLLGEKPKGAVERYMDGDDARKKNQGGQRMRDSDDRRDNMMTGRKNRDSLRDDDKDKDDRDRDPRDNPEPGDLATFNLKNFIRLQNSQPNFANDSHLPKASQMFRPEVNSADPRQIQKEKEQHDARAADFMQILKPRTSGAFIGANDPLNSPDLTRREMNPIRPRPVEASSSARSPFAPAPSSPAARIQENNMFGVTGPAAAGLGPTVSAPIPQPEPSHGVPRIVIDAPKRPFN